MSARFLIATISMAIASSIRGEALLDFWDQAPRIICIPEPKNFDKEIIQRQQTKFINQAVKLRYDRAKVGDFSAEVPSGPVVLLAGIWGQELPVPSGARLEFWLSAEGREIPVRSGDFSTVARAEATEDGWTRYQADWSEDAPRTVASLNIDLTGFPGPVLLDGVIFRSGDQVTGLTDKFAAQWKQEEESTRPLRVKSAFAAGTDNAVSGELRQWFDKIWSGQEVSESNVRMRELFQTELQLAKDQRAKLWDLALNVRLIQTYYELGHKGRNLLEPATEAVLLELLWERTKDKNDIGWASSNTWWLTASENHDLNAKVTNLVSSRIFSDEPAYRDRTYPNAAHEPGYGYWFHIHYSQDGGYGPVPPASWAPSGPRTPAEHYVAWVKFFVRYFGERGRRGFFLEHASPIYMKWSLGFLQTLHRYGGDEQLKQRTTDFLDLVWADWAQAQIGGIRGGPKTRHQHVVGGRDSMSDLSRFLLGGPGTTNLIYTSMLVDDYALPEIIYDLALDSKGRGIYEIIARGVGEEESTRPRPAGTQKTLTVDRDARFLRYLWVTPDYILGTQMDHPDSVHSALSTVGRWHGLTVAGDPQTRILPTGGAEKKADGEESAGRVSVDMEVMYQTAQNRNTLIVQQTRRFSQIAPGWFPLAAVADKPITIHTGDGWDEVIPENGWLFFRRGNAYAAVREILPRKTVTKSGPLNIPADVSVSGDTNLVEIDDSPPVLNSSNTGFELKDKYSAVIIHAGSAAEHGSFAAFRHAVAQSRLGLHKTVVPGYYFVTYKGSEKDSKEILLDGSAPEIPLIGGEPVNYQPRDLFESPYLRSEFGTGHVTITKGGRTRTLDFSR